MDFLDGIPIDMLLSILPAVVLFLYGIEHFSKEILKASGDFFRSTVHKLTKTPVRGLVSGMIVCSIIQSSTATTLIAVGLVNAGLISFSQSLGVIFGANIGTAVTAQLIALKLTAFAPVFIVIGFIVDIIGGKYKFIGKPLFYFGLVFFSLTLLSGSVEVLKDNPQVLSLFSHFTNPLWGVFVGFIVTNLFQSSSVTTGIVVIFAQGGLIGFSDALLLILGANIGTTVTTLLASTRMDLAARRAAAAHFLFNVLGVILILPFLPQFSAFVESLGGDEGQMVANAHMLFNVSAALLFLLALGPFEILVKRLVPGEQKEIVLAPKYLNGEVPKDNTEAFKLVEKEIHHMMDVSRDMYDEVIHSIQARKDCRSRVDKL
ncbi:MAG: Na/Pi symporter [Candidatus Micrarchaeia archaeon]